MGIVHPKAMRMFGTDYVTSENGSWAVADADKLCRVDEAGIQEHMTKTPVVTWPKALFRVSADIVRLPEPNLNGTVVVTIGIVTEEQMDTSRGVMFRGLALYAQGVIMGMMRVSPVEPICEYPKILNITFSTIATKVMINEDA